jgi:hypothetical protein
MIVARCHSRDERACGPCGNTYRNQVRWRAADGFVGKAGQLGVLTFTAPGADVLPWDTKRCRHASNVTCSGKRGCMVDKDAAAAWNGTAAERWNHLLQDLRRMLGDVQYFRAVEVQERGLLHFHIPFRAERVGWIRVKDVRRLAIKHGFGHQVKVDTNPALERLAGYVAKYVSKSVSERKRAPMPEGRSWRVYTASRDWGRTMASIRLAQMLWAVARREGLASGESGATDSGDGEAVALDSKTPSYTALPVSAPGLGM